MVVGDFTTGVDTLVIGGGIAGYTAAIRAAQLGREVTLVERENLGGLCLNSGCIPTKSLLAAAEQYRRIHAGTHMGIRIREAELDFSAMQKWKDSVVSQLRQGVAKLLKENNVTVISGEALFASEREVRVITEYKSECYRFEHCIIATGSRVKRRSDLFRHPAVITYHQVLQAEEIPKRLVVVGGGYVAVEMATIFRKLGAEVVILSEESRLLPEFDPALVRFLLRSLKKLGITVELAVEELAIGERGQEVSVSASRQGVRSEWTADKVLIDCEREPNTDELQLATANVKTDERGFILVDDRQRTSNPHVYAIGDVTGPPLLAHKGSYEAKVAAEVIAGRAAGNDARAIPRIVYSDPELATVGLTEEEARKAGYEVMTGRFPFAALGRALTLDAKEGVALLVADRQSRVVLGAQLAGPQASEVIALAGYAIEMGMTVDDIALIVHAHPTLAEVMQEVAEAARGLAIHTVNRA